MLLVEVIGDMLDQKLDSIQSMGLFCVDSLGNQIEDLQFEMTRIEENLRTDIRSVEGDVRTLSDDLSTYKRNTNRAILDIQERINVIESDLKALTEPPEGESDEDN